MPSHERFDSSPPRILWPLPPANWPARLLPGSSQAVVHAWAIELDVESGTRLRLLAHLTEEEDLRAQRFHFERDRNRYIVGRATLRLALGRYLDIPSRKVPLIYGENGKPLLDSQGAGACLHFNLAHSRNLGLLAVTRATEIGVDVEALRPMHNATELVNRFFSPRESGAFGTLAESGKPAAFFNLWTRKEALLKATGEGIGRLLNQVEVTFLPGEPARLLHVPGDSASRWNLVNLAPAEQFTGALVVPLFEPNLTCWHWNHDAPA